MLAFAPAPYPVHLLVVLGLFCVVIRFIIVCCNDKQEK